MASLNSRGHEVVDPKPFEPAVPLHKRAMSVFDLVRQQTMLARLAASEEIKTDDDLLDEENFVDDFDNLNAPSGGPAEIPDEYPDLLLPAKKEKIEVPDVPPADAPEKSHENQVDTDS